MTVGFPSCVDIHLIDISFLYFFFFFPQVTIAAIFPLIAFIGGSPSCKFEILP